MVHEKLLAQNPNITFKELRKLERIDARKAMREKELDLAREGVATVGSVAKAAGTALVGPVGLVAGFLLINYLEKGASFPKSGWKYVVKGTHPPQIIGFTPIIMSGHTEQSISGGSPIYGPRGPETVIAGPYDQNDEAVLALSGVSSDWAPMIVKYHEYEPALDESTALAAKTALTAAGLGSLLKTIGGALT